MLRHEGPGPAAIDQGAVWSDHVAGFLGGQNRRQMKRESGGLFQKFRGGLRCFRGVMDEEMAMWLNMNRW